MLQICHICQILHVHILDYYITTYTSYELGAFNNVIRSTGIHTFHITGKSPWTNMPGTLHKYLPLHFYCSLHIGSTLLHITTYTSYELGAFNNVIRSTGIHTFHITGKSPWTNMPGTLHKYLPLHFYCSLHIGSTLLHISSTNQWTATLIYHIAAKYVPAKNAPQMPEIRHMPNHLLCIYEGSMPMYMPHMKPLSLLI